MKYTEEMTTSEILLRLASMRNALLQAVNDIEKISKNICYKAEQTEPSLEQFRVGLEYHTDATHFGKAKGESITTDKTEQTEPQTCEECEHWNDTKDGCADRHGCKTEPQTDCCIYDSQRDYEYDLALEQIDTDCPWK